MVSRSGQSAQPTPPPTPPDEHAGDAASTSPLRRALERVEQWGGGSWTEAGRRMGLAVVLLGATWFLLKVVDPHYPVREWLFWRYAAYWLLTIYWVVACVALGHVTVRWLLPTPVPFVEHLTYAFSVGVVEFFLLMFGLGAFRLYGTACFFGLPLGMILVGGRPLWRTLRRYTRHVRHRRRAPPWWVYPVVTFGLIALAMCYFLILTPDNVQFDSRWKHLAVAEDYIAYGGIRRSQEGFTVVTYPHLASFVYAWGWMLPWSKLFDRIELAAHLEFSIFIMQLPAIVALVRRLVPGARASVAWVVRFLFPGVLLYDSSVSLGADHVAALFVAPAFLAMLRLHRDMRPRTAVLLAFVLSGGLLVKYSATFMLLPVPALAVLVAMAPRAYRTLRGRDRSPQRHNWILAPLTLIGAGLVITAPHWLKNLIWYGDPLYPVLHKHLTERPWTQDSADLFIWGYQEFQFWRPERTLDGVYETLKALWTFSFIPNDWPRLHGKVPVFGSLFTLSLLCLPFLRKTKRIWVLYGTTHLAVFVWYWNHHQDRYLQAILPWMAAATAAVFVLLWRRGWLVRGAMSLLIGLQIVWGGDVYFIPTHAMSRSVQKRVLDLFAAGHKRNYDKRLRVFEPYLTIGEILPDDAHVLLHDNHIHTGIDATSVSDWGAWQFGISYGRLKSAREVYDLYKSMGITHLLWNDNSSHGWDSLAGDLVFFDFVIKYGQHPRKIRGHVLAEMPTEPPPDEPFGPVLFLGCDDLYKGGLYNLSDVTVPVFGPRNRQLPTPQVSVPRGAEPPAELVRRADYVVTDPRCAKVGAIPRTTMQKVAQRKILQGPRGMRQWDIWIRTSAPAAPTHTPTPAGDEPPTDEDDDTQTGP